MSMRMRESLLVAVVLGCPGQLSVAAQPRISDREALNAWVTVFGMYRADHGGYPTLQSIDQAAGIAQSEDYWHQPQTTDASGQAYRVTSNRESFRIETADGSLERQGSGGVVKRPPAKRVLAQSVGGRSSASPVLPLIPPASVGTTLMLTKSGSDIVWTWGGSGTLANGASSTDSQFRQVRTHFRDLPTPPTTYTWVGGLTEASTLRFFDVSDETEPNKGDPLPPLPPVIDPNDPATNLDSLYIGSGGVIIGENFSPISERNWICFDGGVCTQPSTATTTQLDFTVPPGAVSGSIYVVLGERRSNSAAATVRLENVSMQVRSLGFSDEDTSFWQAGRDTSSNPQNSVYRVYYDLGTELWVRENRAPGQPSRVYYCSTQTSRDGWLVCGLGTVITGGGGGTRKVDTDNAGSNLNNCMNLGGGTSNVRGAAVDPNPGADPLRDVAYFAHASSTDWKIQKVGIDATGCTGVLDSNFGNMTWNGIWGGQVGMAVDPVTGDLYMSGGGTIYRIEANETVTPAKSGLSDVYALDIAREGTDDPGWVLVGDNGTGIVSLFALDNLGGPPTAVTTANILRAVDWGGAVFGGPLDPSNPDNVVRTIISHNDDTAMGRRVVLRPASTMTITPAVDAPLWISGPKVEPGPINQGQLRLSDDSGATNSTGAVVVRWVDGQSRDICAWIGDPGRPTSGYDPVPAGLPCDVPRNVAAGDCDNFDPLVVAGVGSFTDSNGLVSCKSCGGTGNPCVWEFRITPRFAGDNYKVYFSLATSPFAYFQNSSAVYTAWKHAHLEYDRMARSTTSTNVGRGGILKSDGLAGTSAVIVAMNPDATRAEDLAAGDRIHIFDASKPVESASHEQACIGSVTPLPASLHVVVDLRDAATCTTPYLLQSNYDADDDGSADDPWDFTSGESAAVYVDAAPLIEADVSDLRQTFDDAFVSFHVPALGDDGSNIIPHMPAQFFDRIGPPILDSDSSKRFSAIWFSHFIDDGMGSTPPRPVHFNSWHLIGSTDITTVGADALTDPIYDFSLIFVEKIENNPSTTNAPPHIREDTNHETAHHFRVNICSPDEHDAPGRFAWCGICGTGSTIKCIMNVPPYFPGAGRWRQPSRRRGPR